AKKVLEQAVTHDASDADVRIALSEALRRSGQLSEAIRMVETIRVQYPKAPRALLTLRDLYREAGRWEEGAQVQQSYLERLPHDRRTDEERERLLDVGCRAVAERPESEKRIEGLRALVENEPSYLPGVVALSDAFAAGGDEQQAVRLLDRSVRRTPCLIL